MQFELYDSYCIIDAPADKTQILYQILDFSTLV